MPRICFLQRSADPSIGPFFEFNRPVGEAFEGGRLTGRVETIYLSKRALQEIMRAAGSPFTDPEQEVARLRAQLTEEGIMRRILLEERDALERRLEEESPNGHVDPDELVERIVGGLVEKLDERYAKKTGPKKAQGFS